MTERVTKTSTCLCGSVSLTLTGEDKGACMCHCKNCQLSSGSSFAHNYRLSNGELKIRKGEELVREYADQDTKSGNTLLRHFCGKCVSHYPLLDLTTTLSISSNSSTSFCCKRSMKHAHDQLTNHSIELTGFSTLHQHARRILLRSYDWDDADPSRASSRILC